VGGNPAGSISGEPFHGWIDNVFVINRALTDAEIANIRAGGVCALTGGPCNRAPSVAVGGPYMVDEGSPVALSLSAADPDGDALSLSWDLGDGTFDTGALPTWHEYADDGTYTVSVTAADPAGLSATLATTVQVANVRPTVAPIAGASLVEGEVYTASVSFTDPGADRWSATVDYGDGSPPQTLELSAKTAVLAHRYAASGTYTVRVAVRDDDDPTPGTATAAVTVNTVGGAMTNAVSLVWAAVASGELTAQDADKVAGHFTSASSFLARADAAATPQQEAAMLRSVLRNLNQVLSSLPAGGTATAALREQTLRLRAVVQARLAAI
jgi:PKD repeat protein